VKDRMEAQRDEVDSRWSSKHVNVRASVSKAIHWLGFLMIVMQQGKSPSTSAPNTQSLTTNPSLWPLLSDPKDERRNAGYTALRGEPIGGLDSG